jgi:hypothetical protein
MRIQNALYTLCASLATGFIFFFFSELVFWARVQPGDSLLNWLKTWLAYSLMAFLFLALVSYYRLRSLAAIFLAGAFFGWLGEGIVVQTAYENLPLSISFTGLAWHALITVLGGWLALQKALRNSFRASLLASLLGGLLWGFWGVTWIYEQNNPASPSAFAYYTFLATILLSACLYIIPGVFSRPFTPSRWSVIVVSGFFLFLFVFVAVPAVPPAVVILPILFLILWLTFRRNRQRESAENPLAWLGAPIPRRNLAALVLMPVIASLFYWVYALTGLRQPVNWVIYLVTTPAGFILFFYSIWYIWLGNKHSPTSPASEQSEASPSDR